MHGAVFAIGERMFSAPGQGQAWTSRVPAFRLTARLQRAAATPPTPTPRGKRPVARPHGRAGSSGGAGGAGGLACILTPLKKSRCATGGMNSRSSISYLPWRGAVVRNQRHARVCAASAPALSTPRQGSGPRASAQIATRAPKPRGPTLLFGQTSRANATSAKTVRGQTFEHYKYLRSPTESESCTVMSVSFAPRWSLTLIVM